MVLLSLKKHLDDVLIGVSIPYEVLKVMIAYLSILILASSLF